MPIILVAVYCTIVKEMLYIGIGNLKVRNLLDWKNTGLHWKRTLEFPFKYQPQRENGEPHLANFTDSTVFH